MEGRRRKTWVGWGETVSADPMGTLGVKMAKILSLYTLSLICHWATLVKQLSATGAIQEGADSPPGSWGKMSFIGGVWAGIPHSTKLVYVSCFLCLTYGSSLAPTPPGSLSSLERIFPNESLEVYGQMVRGWLCVWMCGILHLWYLMLEWSWSLSNQK